MDCSRVGGVARGPPWWWMVKAREGGFEGQLVFCMCCSSCSTTRLGLHQLAGSDMRRIPRVGGVARGPPWWWMVKAREGGFGGQPVVCSCVIVARVYDGCY